MNPFFAGMAIGIAIGLPIFILCVILGVGAGVVGAIRNGWRGAHSAAALENAQLVRGRGRIRREKDLAWMERHWVTRPVARLNRWILG
ncbi:MAG TPA: hypothetical protein VNF45_01090 [Candidatus Binataceae bacterium]|nr:hypothetical protein [Candidatus Binataceae bacterium]